MILHQMPMGVGDNLYMRAFVPKRGEECPEPMHITTPWPGVFWDCHENVRVSWEPRHTGELSMSSRDAFCDAGRKIVQHQLARFNKVVSYDIVGNMKEPGSTVEEYLADISGDKELDISMDIPDVWEEQAQDWILIHDVPEKFGIVRPVVKRKVGWDCPARNPDPEYFKAIAAHHQNQRRFFIGLWDRATELQRGTPIPVALDASVKRNRMPFAVMVAMVKMARVNIAPQSFMLPLCGAIGARGVFLWDGFCTPDSLIGEFMDMDNISIVEPRRLCDCRDKDHRCRTGGISSYEDFRYWTELGFSDQPG